MAEPETDEENVSFYSHPQFWQALFVMAIVLNVFAIVASDLGLDAHVEGAYIETENGWALDWGDTRTEDSDASNPDVAKEVPENSVNSEMIMPFAVLGMIVAILVATKIGFNRTTITILILNPALIFSIGRGYSEYTYIAILGIAWIVWSHSKKYTDRYIPKVTAITMAAVLVLWIAILKLKMEPMGMLLPLLGLIVIGVLIDRMPDDWFNPQKAMIGGFGIGLLSIVALGMMGYGSFTIVNTESIRFIQAVPVAIFGAAIVYGLVGMVLWPFAKQTWTLMGESNDRLTGELSLFIGTLTGVIIAYVACLWTYESTLWSSEWPWHMWTMGNNGRYITILAIPCFVLIKRVNGEIDWRKRKAVVGILILLPISMAAGIHGQTYWTDDAAEVLDENMGDNEDFLFVHDATLGMHYLYTFHTYIDDVSERNITGHWRSPESGWETELFSNQTIEYRGDLSSVQWVVLAPGVEWTEAPEGWSHTTGDVDFMNGGGEWEVWTNQNVSFASET